MSAPTLPPPTRPGGWADLATRPLGPTRGWRPALRMALRDLRRHPARTAAAAVMVLVPVMLASAVAAVVTTAGVTSAEQRLADLASAEALVEPLDPFSPAARPWSSADVEDALGAPVVPVVTGGGLTVVGPGSRTAAADLLASDFTDPATDGLLELRSGTAPQRAGEAVLSTVLAERLRAGVGDTVVVDGTALTVTGIGHRRWTGGGSAVLTVPAGSLGATETAVAELGGSWWLVPDLTAGQPEGRTLADGTLHVVTRADLESWRDGPGLRDDLATAGGNTLVLVPVAVTLVVLEIALLAGPAFAVGVRQQQQTLALLAATGGDGRALRRVVLAQGLVVGAAAALVGAAVGTVLAVLGLVAVRATTTLALGPLEVPWAYTALFALIGAVASLAAAVVPAVTASRATVVGALTPPPSRRLPWRRPLLGVVLLAAGTWLLLVATWGLAGDAVAAGSLSILLLGVGMVLVVPLPVALLARLTRRAPLGLRLAGRESTRAAARSVAAVAAVAGASAALVAALGLTSAVRTADAARYEPRTAWGVTTVDTVRAAEVEALVRGAVPGARTAVVGDGAFVRGGYVGWWLPSPACPALPADTAERLDDLEAPWRDCVTAWQAGGPGGAFLTPLVAGSEGAALLGYELTAEQAAVLDGGGVLVASWADLLVDGSAGTSTPVATVTERLDGDPESGEGAAGSTPTPGLRTAEVPLGRFEPAAGAGGTTLGAQAVMLISPALADRLGHGGGDRVLVLPPGVAGSTGAAAVRAASRPVRDAVAPLQDELNVYTETGYRDDLRVVELVVVAAAALVLLGATFTATALALADARRDRTVLTAVGASPRTQRVTAGATAFLVAGTGALVGGLVGLVPAVVVGRDVLEPSLVSYGLGLTDGSTRPTDGVLGVLPWGWFALVLVGLPLLAGLVVGLVARGRPDAEAARLSARVG